MKKLTVSIYAYLNIQQLKVYIKLNQAQTSNTFIFVAFGSPKCLWIDFLGILFYTQTVQALQSRGRSSLQGRTDFLLCGNTYESQ